MSDIAIKVNGLSKKYLIGHQKSDSIKDSLKNGVGRFLWGQKQEIEEFWALKDINFEIKKGEAVGIIGKNGAGKSTLLKILSRITHPTEGRFEMNGRVSSLLEVGTGFHPELSGRENIYLNGTILGMTRSEIKSKFDEIVSFSGVEKFLDTPVKHYSSGMYVRLAFAVAAHLEPEILIIDEVLAVGDAEFQKKCLGKMNEVTTQGRTVLFVSHNMAAIQNLCSKAIYINQGKVSKFGQTDEILTEYNNLGFSNVGSISIRTDRSGKQNLKFINVLLMRLTGQEVNAVCTGDSFKIIMEFEKINPDRISNVRFSLAIRNNSGPLLIFSSDTVETETISLENSGSVSFTVQRNPLTKGVYWLTLFVESSHGIEDLIEKAFQLNVESGIFYNSHKTVPTGWEGQTVLTDYSFEII